MSPIADKKTDLETKLDDVIKKSDNQKRILKKILQRLNDNSESPEKENENNSNINKLI